MIKTSEITAAFDSVVIGWGKLFPAFSLGWQNSGNDSLQDASGWIAFPSHIPAPSISGDIQGLTLDKRGIYQIVLRSPLQSGTRTLDDAADALVEAFNAAMFTGGNCANIDGDLLRLTSPASVGASYTDEAGRHVAVTMNYRIYNAGG